MTSHPNHHHSSKTDIRHSSLHRGPRDSSSHAEQINQMMRVPWFTNSAFANMTPHDVYNQLAHVPTFRCNSHCTFCPCFALPAFTLRQKFSEDVPPSFDVVQPSTTVSKDFSSMNDVTQTASRHLTSQPPAEKRARYESRSCQSDAENRKTGKMADIARRPECATMTSPWRAVGLECPRNRVPTMPVFPSQRKDEMQETINQVDGKRSNNVSSLDEFQQNLFHLSCINQQVSWSGQDPRTLPSWLALGQVLLRTQMLRNQLNYYNSCLSQSSHEPAMFAKLSLQHPPMPHLPGKEIEHFPSYSESSIKLKTGKVDQNRKAQFQSQFLNSSDIVKKIMFPRNGVLEERSQSLQSTMTGSQRLQHITSLMTQAPTSKKETELYGQTDCVVSKQLNNAGSMCYPLPATFQQNYGDYNRGHFPAQTPEPLLPLVPNTGRKANRAAQLESVTKCESQGGLCLLPGHDPKTSNLNATRADVCGRKGSKEKKAHRCVYCGKLYSRKYGLKIHIRTHTGYKPLKCKVCGRPFGDPSNLNKHVRLHAEGDTPYRCDLCGKVLVRRRDLERHVKSRHPDHFRRVFQARSSTDCPSADPRMWKTARSHNGAVPY